MSLEEELVATLIIMQVQVSRIEDLEKSCTNKQFKNIKNLSRLLVKGIVTNFEDLIKSQWKTEDGEKTSIELITLYEKIAKEVAKSKLENLIVHLEGLQAINQGEYKFENK